MEKEVKLTWFFNQPPTMVWKYLTQPELIEQWLGKTDFKPIAGHKFRFISPYGNDSYCEVLEVKPYSRISYSWQTNSLYDGKPFDSTVVWTLVPKGNGTELQLLHSGFRAVEDAIAHNDGWTRIGNKMAELLNAIKV